MLLVLELSENTPTGTPRHAILGIFHGLRPSPSASAQTEKPRTRPLRWEYHGKLMGKIGETHGIYMGFHGIYLGFD